MRKKVKSDDIRKEITKKRNPNNDKNSVDNSRWDRIKGVMGEIVRVKTNERKKLIEMSLMIEKGVSRLLYVGIDDDNLYYYYEIFK